MRPSASAILLILCELTVPILASTCLVASAVARYETTTVPPDHPAQSLATDAPARLASGPPGPPIAKAPVQPVPVPVPDTPPVQVEAAPSAPNVVVATAG